MCSRRNIVDTNLSINENGHDKKDKGVSEDVILANSHLQDLSEAAHDAESTHYKILEANSNLEFSVKIQQGMEKTFSLYHKFHMKRTAIFELPDKLSQRNKY